MAPTPMSKTIGQDTGSMQELDRVLPTAEQENRAPLGSPTTNLFCSQRNRKPPAYMKDKEKIDSCVFCSKDMHVIYKG